MLARYQKLCMLPFPICFVFNAVCPLVLYFSFYFTYFNFQNFGVVPFYVNYVPITVI